MRRSPRVLLAWAAAVILALTSARLVAGDLASLHRRARDLGKPTTIVVATHDIPLGATVETSDVREIARPAGVVPREAVHTMRDVAGRVAVIPLLREEVVMKRALAAPDRTGVDAAVPPGKRAIHVALKDGYRPPDGAVVDVLAAFDPTVVVVDGAEARAVTVARAALVIGVDDDDRRSEATGDRGVTLLVTEDEARAVAFAATNAELSLALAPPETACCTSPTP